VVWARNKDGGKQTSGSSAVRISAGNKKQRKTTKEVDGQCERRPSGTRNEHERSGGPWTTTGTEGSALRSLVEASSSATG